MTPASQSPLVEPAGCLADTPGNSRSTSRARVVGPLDGAVASISHPRAQPGASGARLAAPCQHCHGTRRPREGASERAPPGVSRADPVGSGGVEFSPNVTAGRTGGEATAPGVSPCAPRELIRVLGVSLRQRGVGKWERARTTNPGSAISGQSERSSPPESSCQRRIRGAVLWSRRRGRDDRRCTADKCRHERMGAIARRFLDVRSIPGPPALDDAALKCQLQRSG